MKKDSRNSEFLAFIKEKSEELKEKNANRFEKKTIEQVAKGVAILEPFQKLLEDFRQIKITVPSYKPSDSKSKSGEKRHLNVMLSDHHYGADLISKTSQIPFGVVEESRRMSAICLQIADYKRQYRDQTTLNLHILGDMIQGKLHDPQSGANITDQVARAFWCLVNGIFFLSTQFPEVVIRFAVGNHGRDISRHPSRAVNDKYDSVEFQLYNAIKAIVETNCPNVTVETETRPYYIYEQFGMLGLMSHGDTHFKPGYPGSNIDIKGLKAQIHAFNATQERKVVLFGFGHVHTAADVDLGEGTVVTNGCMIPTDEYAESIGIFATPCKQQMWETVAGHMFGDHRKIEVNSSHDKDSSLDKIIKPWDSRYKTRFEPPKKRAKK